MSKSKVKTLGDRMKEYEFVSDTKLVKRTPVVVRIDGKAFHTYTRGLDKPFDEILSQAMEYTCRNLVQNIQGCKLAYTQSDEISLLLTDWDKLTTESYFDYRTQKVSSVISSMATMYFNQYITNLVLYMMDVPCNNKELLSRFEGLEFQENIYKVWFNKMGKAMFDARAFNLPEREVCNYFLWRQQDASRNSIQSLGRSKFSAKQMMGKNNNEVQEMLFQEYNINWNDLDTKWKRGFCVCRLDDVITDMEIPLFNVDREYINKFLEVKETE